MVRLRKKSRGALEENICQGNELGEEYGVNPYLVLGRAIRSQELMAPSRH